MCLHSYQEPGKTNPIAVKEVNDMKYFKNGILAPIIICLLTFPCYGDSPGREAPGSLVVWLFLGFCALIVIAQLVPMILVLLRSRSTRQAAEQIIPGSSSGEGTQQSDNN